ncbi:MAG: TldD/PmbA family protein [Candidatus Micrarchaeota archaeon]|nr:TldD/PmbA family protein [Candidatus Micrarchaeota archaeon]
MIDADKFQKLLSNYKYADLRIENERETNTKISDEEVKTYSGSSFGISVRVFANNSWGFASSNSSSADVASLLKHAESLAQLQKGNIKIQLQKPVKITVKTSYSETPYEIQVSQLNDAKKNMNGKNITNKIASSSTRILKKEFFNSEGSEIFEEMSHTYISYVAVAKDGELIQRGHERASSIHGFDKINLYELATNAKEKAERILNAKLPPKGRFTVVLDNEMTGVFSHEAVGHACEADSIIDRESILSGKLGKTIGNELVTIVDDPTADDFGHFIYDDEGVKAEKAELVTNGILKSYMHSRESSAKLKLALNGHARAEGYDSFPIVRMSNTYFSPGKTNVDDVFDIKYGIYLKGMKGGSVDIFSGGFMFKAEEAYEIKDGEKIQILRDVTLTGNILETMKNVELVAKDFKTNPGFCGKFGQSAPVSDGGPHVRVSNMMVG